MGGPSELRERCRAARRALRETERTAADRRAGDRLVALVSQSEGARIGAYVATDGELDLSSALDELAASGWSVHLPVVGPGRRLGFVRHDPGTALRPNRFGIPEPVGGTAVTAADLDVVVVPCVAVGRDGNRLGFGAGFYDRALAGVTGTLLVGVAHDVQVVDHIDARPWDVKLHVVITPSACWDLRSSPGGGGPGSAVPD